MNPLIVLDPSLHFAKTTEEKATSITFHLLCLITGARLVDKLQINTTLKVAGLREMFGSVITKHVNLISST